MAIACGALYCGKRNSQSYFPTTVQTQKLNREYKRIKKLCEPVPQKMSREEICNVAPVSNSELKQTIDLMASADIATQDSVWDERWTVAWGVY